MRYGLELPCGGDGVSVGLLVRLGVEAQRAGWDGVFFEDYLVYYRGQDPATFDPWLVMAVIAGRTTCLTLGTTVTGLLARDPVKLAREALTLHDLSHGRVVLGVGLGDPNDRGAGLNPLWDAALPRGPQMDQRLEVLLGLLAGRVPVWVGGSAQAGAVSRRAARAAGVVPYKLSDTDRWSDFTSAEVADIVAAVAAHRAGGHPASFDVAVGGRRRLASVTAERAAVDEAARGGATWWLEFVHPGTESDMLDAVRRGPVRATAADPSGATGQ
jgi:alkanesulfonate monooxygenase SsuD/methylene tetrahydromethanopterin reductase-like flavin-dependent oxidoreductase (luciferase family)